MQTTTTIGLDIAKSVFQIHGIVRPISAFGGETYIPLQARPLLLNPEQMSSLPRANVSLVETMIS
jgi:hypothetical protein